MQRTRRALLRALTMLPAIYARAWGAESTPASQVLNVMDFEPLARAALPPAHFAYIATGVDDDRTVVHNHDAYSHYEIRVRRFNDVSRLDTTTRVFGDQWPSPLYLSAVSAQGAFHVDAEIGTARAAKSRSTQMMLSSGTSTSHDAVRDARGAPVWQQLYPTNDWKVGAGVVKRAEDAGSTAIALTVDYRGARNNETLSRAMRIDDRPCTSCHINNSHALWHRSSLYKGLDISRVVDLAPLDLTPAYLDRLRAVVKGKLIIKGIMGGEDAGIAVEHGADAVVISNHGGRNEETLRAPIDCLSEVVATVRGRVPVFIDGGIRRGTDIFKALALGATAVGIGRPQVWGLAAFGQPGVEAVIDILNRELATIMRHAGTPTIASITSAAVVRSSG